MKRLGNWVMACLMVGLLLTSCFDPPQYSPIPVIEFGSIIFRDLPDPSAPDSLILTIRFKDGDGNLGLDPTELGCNENQTICFNDKFYFKLSDGSFITYKNYRINHKTGVNDTLPAFIKPANCLKWDVRTVNAKVDTFYVQQNRNYYNIFVEFWVKNDFPAGTYTQYKIEEQFGYPQCANSFNGRFPIMSSAAVAQKTPLDGTIRYAMQSVGFNLLFSVKTLNLKVTIQDRLLNRSNTIETGDFDLTKIRKSG